jgi:predicted PhzF superfamily epimerase YddE/YHI9
MFDLLDNIPKDPATGRAAATLGALLVKCTQTPHTFSLYKDDDMGRPSQIEVHAEAGQVTISGQCRHCDGGQSAVNSQACQSHQPSFRTKRLKI